MESPTPPGPEPLPDDLIPRRKRSPGLAEGCLGRGGCSMGCLAVTLLILLSVSLFVSWLTGSHPILPAAGLVSKDASAVYVLNLREEDPGTASLLGYVVVRGRLAVPSGAMSAEEILKPANLVAQIPALLPVQVVVNALPGGPLMVVSVGQGKGYPRLLVSLGASQQRDARSLEQYGDALVVRTTLESGNKGPAEVFVTSVNNSYILATRP
ncbi:MAG: hypothetical protein FJX76_28480, partial [Armatimonadetes bacterium]|nr:hypothetical protein [Armatimonadota bacterium]